MTNPNYWIKKLLGEEVLTSIKKGFYVSKYYKYANREEYLEYLANVIRYPSYVSLEYALSKYSLIPESVFSVTSVTTKSTRSYKFPFAGFIYKSLKEELFFGYEQKDFEGRTVRIASPAKALFDFLYLKKFGSKVKVAPFLLEYGRINWEVFNKSDRRDFVSITSKARSRKMDFVLDILKKENIL